MGQLLSASPVLTLRTYLTLGVLSLSLSEFLGEGDSVAHNQKLALTFIGLLALYPGPINPLLKFGAKHPVSSVVKIGLMVEA